MMEKNKLQIKEKRMVIVVAKGFFQKGWKEEGKLNPEEMKL